MTTEVVTTGGGPRSDGAGAPAVRSPSARAVQLDPSFGAPGAGARHALRSGRRVIPAPSPPDEAARLAALADLALLDTGSEERFDRLTRLSARILGVPIALISLIDDQRQWYKSRIGIDATEVPRALSFCGHVILDDELLVVPDARLDERFHDSPFVLGDPEVRFYAGRSLHAAGGERVGTLCVIDRIPRQLAGEDRQALDDLAELVERELQQQTLSDAWELNRSLQARYQAIFENLHESISLIRPGEGWILGNSASDRILGYPAGTTRLDNRASFVHPDDEELVTQAFRAVVAGERRGDDPWMVRVRAADGTWRWFESNANDLRSNPDVGAVLVSTRDVTERVERALQHEVIVEESPLGIWTLDGDARITFVNERFASLLGRTVESMVGSAAEDLYPEEDRAAFRERWSASLPGGRDDAREVRYLHADGHHVVVEVLARALFAPDGRHLGAMAMFRDRTHELALEERAAQSERRYGLLFEHSSDVITVLGPDGDWRYSSPAGTRLLGYPRDHHPEGGIFALVHPDDIDVALQALDDVSTGAVGPDDAVTFRVLTAAGETRWFESTAVNLADEPLIGGIMIVSRDVTERVRLNEALAHAAGHDPLTDLANRGRFTEQLTEALARADREGRTVGVCFVDLDRFKPVNDGHGHHVGDEVLCSVAQRLRGTVRSGDVAGRLGGDEFVVLVESAPDRLHLASLAERLATELNRPHETSAGTIACGASVGVACAEAGDDASTLLARADAALYRAKAAGRGSVVFADA